MTEILPPATMHSISSSDSQDLVNSFATYIRSLETETRSLKSLFALSKALEAGASVELQEVVDDIESVVARTEMQVNIFDESMSQELAQLELTLQLLAAAKQQQTTINSLSASMPSHTNSNSKQHGDATGQLSSEDGSQIDQISEEEFLSVSKVIRNRLQRAQINEAFEWLTKYIVEKARILRRGKGNLPKQAQHMKDVYLHYRCAEHGDSMFVAESELRNANSIVFRAGDASGKSILQTLRQLQRIKLVRCNGENTYILL